MHLCDIYICVCICVFHTCTYIIYTHIYIYIYMAGTHIYIYPGRNPVASQLVQLPAAIHHHPVLPRAGGCSSRNNRRQAKRRARRVAETNRAISPSSWWTIFKVLLAKLIGKLILKLETAAKLMAFEASSSWQYIGDMEVLCSAVCFGHCISFQRPKATPKCIHKAVSPSIWEVWKLLPDISVRYVQ